MDHRLEEHVVLVLLLISLMGEVFCIEPEAYDFLNNNFNFISVFVLPGFCFHFVDRLRGSSGDATNDSSLLTSGQFESRSTSLEGVAFE